MSAKHTPGPWTVIAKPWSGIHGPHRMIQAPDYGGLTSIAAAFGDDDAEIDANARLIAKAPDLLEQLSFCCEQLAECMEQNHGRIWDNAQTVLANARAVLADLDGKVVRS